MASYVMGTNTSHDGATCLLKDGRVVVAIEKERLTRRKHDGFNDDATIRYCLDAAGITWRDVDLFVENRTLNPYDAVDEDRRGPRDLPPSVERVNISHHLAHAYSVVGAHPRPGTAIAVLDGRGSSLDNCVDAPAEALPPDLRAVPAADRPGLWEKESLYVFDGRAVRPVLKDFSPLRSTVEPDRHPLMPRSLAHGIGAVYGAVARFVFGQGFTEGKLMGLAPYGRPGVHDFPVFTTADGRVRATYGWQRAFPAGLANDTGDAKLKAHFQLYADLARHLQDETERAVHELLTDYHRLAGTDALGYAGGVALNAVCNGKVLARTPWSSLFVQPAAGDSGVALGCAWYGWITALGRTAPPADGRACFGRGYADAEVAAALAARPGLVGRRLDRAGLLEHCADLLAGGAVLGWFQGPSEFGPRALGHRSILADPRVPGMRDHINGRVKFREDFRPFAPAVLAEEAGRYFEGNLDSPYMISVASVRDEVRGLLPAVEHVDGSARLQTVTPGSDELFHRLIDRFRARTGVPVLLNTSLNRRGMPIVETPAEALDLLLETGLDGLALGPYLVRREG